MKKIVLLLLTGATLFLVSCETTKEISLVDDGNGSFVTTSDMSSLLSMAKMSGAGGAELDKLGEAIDTTVSLSDKVDSIPDLSKEERDILRKGSLGIIMDIKNDKLQTKLSFPFSQTGQISELDRLSARIAGDILKKQLAEGGGNAAPPGMEKMIPQKSIDEYFTTTYSKGLIERKLNVEKYAGIDKDEEMQGLKQMAGMGLGNTKLIFNLPAAVKKTEGKNLAVSDDKKIVTIMTSTEDFFENAKDLEFRIEY